MNRRTDAVLTILTPTTGRASLGRLVQSIDRQRSTLSTVHILLWDDFRSPGAPLPADLDGPTRWSLVMPGGFGKFGDAPGSALRALGLLAAVTPWVTFADDDVYWEPDHVSAMLGSAGSSHWVSTLRRIWKSDREAIGVDRFESVGDDPCRKVPYEMLDNNCMMFRREFGVAAAPLYRETREYNDDRLMYAFLKETAGPRPSTRRVTVNQTCPERLIEFFQAHCDPA